MRDRSRTFSPSLKRARSCLLAVVAGVFALEAEGAPSITSISPDRGSAFIRVTITGTGFGSSQGSSTVTFEGSEAGRYYEWSDSEIEVRPPASLAVGTHAVVVTVGGTASNGVDYTLLPTLSAFCLAPSQTLAEPSGSFQMGVIRSGPTTDAVTVTVTYSGTATHGADYTAPTTLRIAAGDDRKEATLAVVDDSGKEGNERIAYAVSAEGYLSHGCQITLEDDDPNGTPAPAITRVNPRSGGAGVAVGITGSNFGAAKGTSTVTFNGTEATTTSWSASSITATVPAGATTGNLLVTVGGQASNALAFTVTPTPAISRVDPPSGEVGANVEITGSNFGATQRSSTVSFNGTGASVTSWSDTSITATVPQGAATGDVVVTVGGVASNGVPFTVEEPDRPVTLVCPSRVSEPSGRGRIIVLLNGGDEPAADLTFDIGHTGTADEGDDYTVGTLTIAAGARLAQMDPQLAVVDDSLSEGEETIELTLTAAGYEEASCMIELADDGDTGSATAPTITILNPTSGPEGTEVTISGTDFGATQGTSTVTFNGTAVSTYTSWSDTEIVVEVPAGATSGDVVVTVDGEASNGVSFTVTVPSPAVRVDPARLTVPEGGSGIYTVVLATQPAVDVTINVDVPQGASITAYPSSLTFTSSDWDQPQEVTVEEPEDDDALDETYGMIHTVTSSDSDYANPLIEVIAIDVVDNDVATAGVTFDPEELTVPEGGSATYTVVLDTQPTATVWVSMFVSIDANFSVSPSPLAFTVTDWDQPQEVTVEEPEDDNAVDEVYHISHSVTTTDLDYAGIFLDLMEVTVTDNDAPRGPGVRIDPVRLTVDEGGTGSYTVVLDTQPSASVRIEVMAPAGLTLTSPTGGFLDFTTNDWSTVQTVRFTADHDADIDDDFFTVTHSVTSNDTDYSGVTTDGVGVTVIDDDETLGPGLTVIPAEITVLEGGTGSYTVALNTQPAAPVTVAVTVPAGLTLTSPAGGSLTFSTTNWETGRTVTVTAAEDADKLDETVRITHSATSGDTDYSGVTGRGVGVRIADNDILGVVVSPRFLRIDEGRTGTYEVRLRMPTPSDLTVAVTPGEGLTVNKASLVFTAGQLGNWSTRQTVTVTAGEDLDAIDEAVGISHSVSLAPDASSPSEYIYLGNRLVAIEPGWSRTELAVSDQVQVAIVDDEGMTPLPLCAEIVRLNPTAAPVGTEVTITGVNFGANQGNSTVIFNGTPVTTYISWSDTEIVVEVPPGASSGDVEVTIDGQPGCNPVHYTVAPTAIWAVPNPCTIQLADDVDCQVTIHWATSPPTRVQVWVSHNGDPQTPFTGTGTTQGSQVANWIQAAPHTYTFNLYPATDPPPGGSPLASVEVRADSDGLTRGYIWANPETCAIPTGDTACTTQIVWTSRNTSAVRVWVEHNGSTTAFTDVDSIWGILDADFIGDSGPYTFSVHDHSSGTKGPSLASVVVRGTRTATPKPEIDRLDPDSGDVGTEVTISGSGFGSTRGSSSVTFNGTTASTSSWGSSQIVATVPSGATTGPVVVTVNSIGSNTDKIFTMNPTGTLTPSTGSCTIATGDNDCSFTLNWTRMHATRIQVRKGNTVFEDSTQPSDSVAVDVELGVNPFDLWDYSGGTLGDKLATATVTGVRGPRITDLNPDSGDVGTEVTISGSGFGSTRGSSSVTFNGTAVTTYDSWSATSIDVEVPSGATTGNVVVSVPGKPSSNGFHFMVTRMPPRCTISATPPHIRPGGTSRLEWDSQLATSALLNPGGTVDPDDFLDVTPSGNGEHEYELRVTGPGGSATCSVTVTVWPAPEAEIDTDDPHIRPNGTATLEWDSDNADSVTVTDVGTVTPNEEGDDTVNPSVTRTYTIRATNPAVPAYPAATDRVTVTVWPAPEAEIDTDDPHIRPNGTARLEWDSDNADSVTVTDVGAVTPNEEGDDTVRPSATRTYTIRATNPAVPAYPAATDSVTVTVWEAPEAEIDADPKILDAGDTTRLEWDSDNADSVTVTDVGAVTPNEPGNRTLTPSGTKTYVIRATNPAKPTYPAATDRVEVIVNNPEGEIRANPNPCTIPSGSNSCGTRLSWTSNGRVVVRDDDGNDIVSNGSPTGHHDVTGITETRVTFSLYKFSNAKDLPFLDSVEVYGEEAPPPPPTGWISASPNPCQIASGANTCTTTISWGSSNTTAVQVWVSHNGATQTAFTGAGTTSGSQNASWIQAAPTHSYVFSLYDLSNGNPNPGPPPASSLLKTVSVTGEPAPPPPPDPVISGIFPSQGQTDTRVTISGSNFGTDQGTVSFGGSSATIESWGSGTIVVLVPLHLPNGQVGVTVTVPGNTTPSNTVYFWVTGNPFNRDPEECEEGEDCQEEDGNGSGDGATPSP